MDPRRRQLEQLEFAPDAAVLQAARAAVPSDGRFAKACCALLWVRHERALESFLRARARDVADEALGDLYVRFTRWVYSSTQLEADSMRGVAMKMASAARKDALRAAGKHDGVPLDESLVASVPDPLELLADKSAVEELLRRLGARDRRIVEAFLADVPDQDLAAELGCTVGALHVARHRAWNRLRSDLEATT
jgi:DNA-directed RNA polymerase specialized sigma24 family protein